MSRRRTPPSKNPPDGVTLPLFNFAVVIHFRDGSCQQVVRQGTGSYALMKDLEPKLRRWKDYHRVAGWTVKLLASENLQN